MFRENVYALVIYNKQGEIVMVAREKYDGTHVFGLVDEDITKEVGKLCLYPRNAEEAIRSFRARGKSKVLFTKSASELLLKEYGIEAPLSGFGLYATGYKEIKDIVSAKEIEATYVW